MWFPIWCHGSCSKNHRNLVKSSEDLMFLHRSHWRILIFHALQIVFLTLLHKRYYHQLKVHIFSHSSKEYIHRVFPLPKHDPYILNCWPLFLPRLQGWCPGSRSAFRSSTPSTGFFSTRIWPCNDGNKKHCLASSWIISELESMLFFPTLHYRYGAVKCLK